MVVTVRPRRDQIFPEFGGLSRFLPEPYSEAGALDVCHAHGLSVYEFILFIPLPEAHCDEVQAVAQLFGGGFPAQSDVRFPNVQRIIIIAGELLN